MKVKNLTLKNPSIKIDMASFLVFLFVLVEHLRFFKILPLRISNGSFVVLGIISILYVSKKAGIKKQLKPYFFMFIYMFFGLIGVIVNGNIDFQEILWPIGFIGISLVLLNFKMSYRLTQFMYYISVVILSIQILISGNVNNLEAISSRNAISVMVLIVFSILVISSYQNDMKIGIFPVMLGTTVAILAVGRSGILTFFLLLVSFLVFRFDGKKHSVKISVRTLVALASISIFFFIAYKYFEPYIVDVIRNFEARGLESVRTRLWTDYVEKVSKSFRYIVLGAPIEGTYLLNNYSSNLHNSMLMLHAKYGLIVLISVIIMVIKSIKFFLKRKNYLFFTLLIITLFRMQFDYTNFSAQLDVIFFYLVFFRHYENRLTTRK